MTPFSDALSAAKQLAAFALLIAPAALMAAPANPPWMIGSFPGFDVYSNASEAHTWRLLENVLQLQRDFETIWPAPQTANLPHGRIIFCDRPAQFLLLTHGKSSWPGWDSARAFSDDNLSLAVSTTYRSQYAGDYVLADYLAGNSMEGLYANYFMRVMGERIPPWLFYGLHNLIDQLDCTDDAIRFPPAASDTALDVRRRENGSEASLDAALRDRRFLTLEKLFNGTQEPPQTFVGVGLFIDGHPRGPRERDFWAAAPTRGLFVSESYEFIQFCLFAKNGRYRAAIIKFAHEVSNGPPDEAVFQKLFGKSYREMLLALWAYRYTSRDRIYRFPHPFPPPSIAFRPATPVEIHNMIVVWMAQGKAQTGWFLDFRDF